MSTAIARGKNRPAGREKNIYNTRPLRYHAPPISLAHNGW